VLAGFGLLGGVWSIRTSIEQPLAFTNIPQITNQLYGETNSQASDASQILALKNQDTDQDGITDYDELYTYGTSPYLKDSDSDGIDDKDEIDNGTDPNCPEGTECTPIAVFTPTINASTNAATVTNAGTNISTTSNTNPTVDNLDVTQLRAALKNAGAPQAQLDALTDEELVALYADTLGSSSTTNTSTTNSSINFSTNSSTTNSADDSTSVTYSQLRDLTVDQIRQLLILGGADKATLDQLDDDTLKAVFYQSVQNIELSNTNQ